MDKYTLVSNLVSSATWPLLVAFVVIFFRREIRSLIQFLKPKRFKAGPVEIDFFERELDEAREVQLHVNPGARSAPEKELLDMAQTSPRSAVFEAWRKIESIAKKAAIHNGGSPLPDVSTAFKAIRALSRSELITAEEAELFYRLRGLRNQATMYDTMEITETAAKEYVQLAATLEEKLAKLASLQ